MSDWSKVRWTQARQIAELMDLPRAARPTPEVTPQRWLEEQVEQGDLAGAVTFLGHALPRYEAVTWAEAVVPTANGAGKPPELRGAIRRWLDGTDARPARDLAACRGRGRGQP
jgi:hypothetical protein